MDSFCRLYRISDGFIGIVFMPVFGFSSQIAQMIVLTYGIYMIATGNFTVGLLISFLA